MIDIGDLKTRKGLNQIGTLQRVGDACWSSHLRSISSLMMKFSGTCKVLLIIIDEGNTLSQRAEANVAYQALTSFELVFILHLMKEIIEFINSLCKKLQCQSQDILNAILFVSSIKEFIQKFRDDGWDDLLTTVKSFCELRSIDIPYMNARYVGRRGQAGHQQDDFTIEHHY